MASSEKKKNMWSSEKYRPFINYELFVWFVYISFVTLAITDRFLWNVWPRETYKIGKGTAGSDFVDGLKPGPWSVKMYDAVARASGRFDIMALNLLFFTMSHTTYSWLADSWMARNVFDMRNYMEANRRLHKWNGIALVSMTLLHVWSILFPCIFHGWNAQIVLGSFEWILSERGPKGFKDANVATKTMSLQGDDVFRIVEMTILLGILLPLSIRWISTRWHLGVQVHNMISVLYFIDIVRRHTHPHSWILNTPFFLWWILDIVIGIYWKREQPEVYRIHLSQDYMVLFWNQIHRSNIVGPKYYLKLTESSHLERAHVFTAFENRCNLDLVNGKPWSSGVVVRVYHNKRIPRLGKKDNYSHTKRIAESTDLELWTWGPFQGEMSLKVRASLGMGRRPVTLVAGGSAVGYIIDALQQHIVCRNFTPLTCLYTARDKSVFLWVLNTVMILLKRAFTQDLHITIALTDGGGKKNQETAAMVTAAMVSQKQTELEELSCSSLSSSEIGKLSTLRVQHGRLNLAKEIREGNIVYFQGSGALQKAVMAGCKENRCKLVTGPAYDVDDQKRNSLLASFRRAASKAGTGLV